MELGDVGLRRARRPRDGADRDVGDAGRLKPREVVVEDEVRMRLPGPRPGGEESRAVEPPEEGVPDAGRDGGVAAWAENASLSRVSCLYLLPDTAATLIYRRPLAGNRPDSRFPVARM